MAAVGGSLNSTVAITISVVDANSAATIQKVEQQIVGLGVASNTATTALKNVGTAATETGAATTAMGAATTTATAAGTAGYREMGGAVQGVRLAVQELGLHVPRAMESIIAQNETLRVGLAGVMNAFIALGAVSIFVQLGKEAYDLYERYLDVNKALDEYHEKAQKAAETKLFDTASIETTKSLLDQISSEMDAIDQKRQDRNAQIAAGLNSPQLAYSPAGAGLAIGGVADLVGRYQDAKDSKQKADEMAQRDQLAEHQKQLDQQLTMSRLHGQAQYDEAVTKGYAQIDAKEKDTIAEVQARYDFMKQQESDAAKKSGHAANPDAYNAAEGAEIQRAYQQAEAERINLARQSSEQTIQLQNQAIDSGLKGEALYDAQREQAIAAITRKFQEGELSRQAMLAQTAAIEEKFDNAKMARLQQQERETQKLESEAQNAGLTGIARIQANANARIGDIGNDQALPTDQRARREAAVQQQANVEIEKSQQEFQQRLQQLETASDNQQLQGLARIEAETKKHVDEVTKLYKDEYGQLAANDERKIAAEQSVQDAITRIEQDAQKQRAAYAQTIDEQTAKMERQAAEMSLKPWQLATQQIIDQYNDRVTQTQKLLSEQVINEHQAAQQIIAAHDLEAAQLRKEKENQDSGVDQFRSGLGSLMSNPGQFMQERMGDLASMWLKSINQSNPATSQMLSMIFGGNGGELPGASASGTLNAAGSTLVASGNTLATAGASLTSAASQLSGVASTFQSGGGSASASPLGSALNLFRGGSTSNVGGGIADTSAPGNLGFDWNPFSLTPSSAAGGAGVAGSSASSVNPMSMISDIAGMGSSLANDFSGANFGSSSSSATYDTVFDANGNPIGAGGSLSATGMMSAGMGLIGVGQNVANGNIGGAAMSGLSSGAAIGSMIMPGIGTAVGAVLGGIGGAIGGFLGSIFSDHGRVQAMTYEQSTVVPELISVQQQFQAGTEPGSQALRDLNELYYKAQQDVYGFGSDGRNYFLTNIGPEIQAVQSTIQGEMAGGRGNITMNAAQFHSGGLISDFGDLATSSTEGFVHAMVGERVMNPFASSRHGAVLDAVNRGFDVTSMVAAARSPQVMGGGRTGSGDTYHITAMDAKSFSDWLHTGSNPLAVRSAVNVAANRYGGKGQGING